MFSFADLAPFGTIRENALYVTKGFTLSCSAAVDRRVMLFCTDTSCEGAPAGIFFRLWLAGKERPLYQSHTYHLNGKQRFGIPPILWQNITLEIVVDVPEKSMLSIRALSTSYADTLPKNDTDVRYNAHLGFLGMAPENTEIAFRLAALCGFKHCICVPKITKDGVLVCTHDTTINHAARYADGRELETDIYVKNLTYKELLAYDFGIRKGSVYTGTRIARLEEFFAICAETGMDPMFSTHPALPHEAWCEIKEMLKKNGLLSKFHVKSFDPDIIAAAHRVLGEEIDGYTYDVQQLSQDSIPRLLASGVDPTRSRVGIEVRLSNFQDEDIAKIRAAGMFAAIWGLPRCNFDEVYRRLITLGATEFTEDHHLPLTTTN